MAQDYFGAQLYGLRASIDRVIASYEAEHALPPIKRCDPIPDDRIIYFPGVKNSHVLRPKEGELKVNLKGVSICTTPRNDGRYQGYWMVDGERIYFYGRSVDELQKKIAAAVRKGKPPKRKKTERKTYTLGEWLDEWAKIYKLPKLKATSVRTLNDVIAALKSKFGTVQLAKLDALDIQRYLISVKSNRTRDLRRLYLNAALKKAKILKLIKDNPCEAVELPSYRKERMTALTRDEQTKLLAACKDPKYVILFRFLISTGLRISEALALTPSDFRDGYVHITKNAVTVKGKRVDQETPKSDASVRAVPVRPDAMPPMQSPLVFPYTYNQCKLAMYDLCKLTGIKTSLHGLRHTYATRLEEAGIPPKIKQRLMGHATLEMTQNIYTDVQQDYLNQYIERIRNAFDTVFDTEKNPK